jgi:hypothetical protein
MKVFVSYCHRQGEWVQGSLVPVLRASGAEVLVDWERFKAGHAVIGQMDGTQNDAERHVLVITRDYLASKYCKHEMDRAIKLDPDFSKGDVIPVKLDDAPLPMKIKKPNPLYVDLRNVRADDQWQLLIDQCNGDLGMKASAWLASLDLAMRHLDRKECVNLDVNGAVRPSRWLDEMQTRLPNLACIDLDDPDTIQRDGLVGAILSAIGRPFPGAVPPPPHDLSSLKDGIEAGPACLLAVAHFDTVVERDYGTDLFHALRFMANRKKLVLLVQTRGPVGMILPPTHQLSGIDFKTVELG